MIKTASIPWTSQIEIREYRLKRSAAVFFWTRGAGAERHDAGRGRACFFSQMPGLRVGRLGLARRICDASKHQPGELEIHLRAEEICGARAAIVPLKMHFLEEPIVSLARE